jgi:hypothetical protein
MKALTKAPPKAKTKAPPKAKTKAPETLFLTSSSWISSSWISSSSSHDHGRRAPQTSLPKHRPRQGPTQSEESCSSWCLSESKKRGFSRDSQIQNCTAFRGIPLLDRIYEIVGLLHFSLVFKPCVASLCAEPYPRTFLPVCVASAGDIQGEHHTVNSLDLLK